MNLSFEITDVDWSNPDVQKVIDVIGDKYAQQSKENTRSDSQLAISPLGCLERSI